MATTYYNDIQELYVAYFNRPADYFGLQHWEKVIEDANGDTSAVAAFFASSTEYKETYAGMDVNHTLGQIYQNLFGRPADLDGLTFWAARISAGDVTMDTAVTAIIDGAQNDDLKTINNRVAAAVAFSNEINTGEEALGYSGNEANALAKKWIASITTDASLAAAVTPAALAQSVAEVAQGGIAGAKVTLTTGTDSIPGTAGNDTITAVLSLDQTARTLTALDSIDGGSGVDTLQINDLTAMGLVTPGLVVKNVENVVMRAAGAAHIDTSTWTGVTKLQVTQSTDAIVEAAGTTAIEVTGATGTVWVDGGSSQTVTTSGKNTNVTMGNDVVANGAVSVTHTAQGIGNIWIDGGTSVSVTASGASGNSAGTINIGQGSAATDLPTGAVTVNTTGAATEAGSGPNFRADINVRGGTTVTVNQTATSSDAAALDDTNGAWVQQSDVTIVGGNNTTKVVVSQSAAVDMVVAETAVAGSKETAKFTFADVTANTVVTVGGLSFTAAKDLKADKVAAAFANLSAGAVQGSAPTANGIYSGTLTTGWTSGAVASTSSGSTATYAVTATATTTGDKTNLTASGATVVVTAGTSTTDAVEGVLGIAGGTVAIVDNGKKVLADVTVNGYGGGSFVISDALTKLTLSNSNAGFGVGNAVATSLDLSLNAVGNSDITASVDLGSTYTTLNLAASGDDSVAAVIAGGVQALNVSGSKAADLTGSSLGALKTVTVTGSAGVKVDASGTNVSSVDASGTTGNNTVSINAANATYTGGKGADKVTLTTSTTTKAVTLGDGDDSLTLATGSSSLTANMSGGTGSDTLVMAAVDAASASGSTTFATKIDGFEKLSLGAVAPAGTATVDLANMDNISYVISAGSAPGIAEVQTFTVAAGTGAAVAEKQTFTITGPATTAGNIVVAGVTIALVGTETADQIGALIAGAAYGPTIAGVSYSTPTVTITYTTAAGNVAAAGASAGTTGTAFSAVQDNAVAYDSNAGNMTVTAGGTATNVALTAGMTNDAVGNAIAAALATGNGNTIASATYDSATDTVRVTYTTTAGDVGVLTVADAVAPTGAGFSIVTDNVVTGAAAAGAGALTLTNMANAGTLELTAVGGGAIVTMKDPAGTADSFNIVTKLSSANTAYGTVDVAGVESVNLNVNDTAATVLQGGVQTASLTLKDAALKSVVVTGNAHLNLSLDANVVALTSVDGSAMTGKLTAGTNGTVAQTIKGGAAADSLTANGSGDILLGGAGNDTLIVHGNLATLTGGAGADTFNVAFGTSNLNAYATITDLAAGDKIQFATSGDAFNASKVTLGDTAVFQDFANAAINATDLGDISWFQFAGNTYVVQHVSVDAATAFANGTDVIVKITGAVDLSNASYSSSADTLLIG
jgi:hypothetical protein